MLVFSINEERPGQTGQVIVKYHTVGLTHRNVSPSAVFCASKEYRTADKALGNRVQLVS